MVVLRPRKHTCYSSDNKQSRGRKEREKSYFDEIPNELIITIIARVASSSIADLCNAKLSCKTLMRICDDSYVLKHATLEKFPVIPWPLKGSNTLFQMSFIELCQKNDNPEALYRKGVVDFFRGGRTDHALDCLKLAKEAVHLGASYAIGIILILTGERKKGTRHLGAMKKDKNLVREVKKGREKLKKIIRSMWPIHNEEIVKERPTCCSLNYQHIYGRRGWSLENDEEYIECETCMCDSSEVNFIYELVGSRLK